MTDAMRQLMQNLKEKVTLGIITNGPAQHQWDKVNALGVTEWIPVGYVFISGALVANRTRGFSVVRRKEWGFCRKRSAM